MQRGFRTDRPHRKCATDVTEFNIRGEEVRLSPVLDLYNQEVVAYEVARTPRILMGVTMLDNALRKVGDAKGLVLHSDQGWQYQMTDTATG
ncbi:MULTISPECIES: DDE-type integrase/transposase/recombinase [unclassified Halomonas]|uniref:DDE-type integrase/transposase/recombinase n=1 Tax=Halomonas sp. FL8 TaxID=1904461 RepID=UPI0023B7D5F4|nr:MULTISPECIES: DDE-type integrase/transposase/recombinase [unclassified Halomonas]